MSRERELAEALWEWINGPANLDCPVESAERRDKLIKMCSAILAEPERDAGEVVATLKRMHAVETEPVELSRGSLLEIIDALEASQSRVAELESQVAPKTVAAIKSQIEFARNRFCKCARDGEEDSVQVWTGYLVALRWALNVDCRPDTKVLDDLLLDRLDGLKAYDGGSTDSGIKDDVFKSEVVKRNDIEDLLKELLFRRLRGDGTLEDVKACLEWIEDEYGLNYPI